MELNKPAFEVALEIPRSAEQTLCCRSQRFDCGVGVFQAGPGFYNHILLNFDRNQTSGELSSKVASECECDSLREPVVKRCGNSALSPCL